MLISGKIFLVTDALSKLNFYYMSQLLSSICFSKFLKIMK